MSNPKADDEISTQAEETLSKTTELMTELQNDVGYAEAPQEAATGEVLPAGVRGRPFVKGASGNPNGRPRGSLNRSTRMAQAALADNMDLLLETALSEAIEKKSAPMIRFLLSRVLPAARENPMALTMPEVTSKTELSDAKHRIVQAVANGEISPSEASKLIDLVEAEFRTHHWANNRI